MSDSWNNVNTVCCKPWLVLPTVYSDALSYGEQLDKFCYSLNKLIENNNILPDYIADKIKEYISSGAIGEVVREILANYILNVKYPPKGITPAVGNGSADDTEAIQGCIDYAAENGGVVYFPYGSYLTQPLTMKDNVSLFGFGRYSTKVVLKGGATKALLNGNASNLSVCNLTLDGNSGIQVNDVNVIDMTGSNLMFNDLVIRDGYKLFEFVGDGHLQLSNIVFGNAVENCFSVDGNVIVQTNNLLFTALSKVGGVSVVDIKANGGNYDFNSVAKCDTCMLISGNDNKVVAMIGGAAEDYVDTGEHNNVEIVGHSQKEYYSGDVKKDANNSETTLQGTRSLHVVGTNTVAYDSDSTESVDGNKSTIVTGNTIETNNGVKTVTNNNFTETSNKRNINVKGANIETSESKTVTVTEEYDENANVKNENATSKNVNVTNLDLNTTNPIKYRTPEKLDSNFNYIPFLDRDGNEYKVLTRNEKLDLSNTYNVKDYGALGDGETDDSDAIINAIQACYNNQKKDGVVYFPIGKYVISKQITVPYNITLQGVRPGFPLFFASPNRPNIGSWLFITNTDTTQPLVTNTTVGCFILQGGAKVNGFGVWYPNQNDTRSSVNFTSYTPTFTLQSYGCEISDILAMNPYILICQNYAGGRHSIHDIWACCLKSLLLSYRNSEINNIYNITFNRNILDVAYNESSPTSFVNYLKANVIAFDFRGGDWAHLYGIFCYNVNTAFRLGKCTYENTVYGCRHYELNQCGCGASMNGILIDGGNYENTGFINIINCDLYTAQVTDLASAPIVAYNCGQLTIIGTNFRTQQRALIQDGNNACQNLIMSDCVVDANGATPGNNVDLILVYSKNAKLSGNIINAHSNVHMRGIYVNNNTVEKIIITDNVFFNYTTDSVVIREGGSSKLANAIIVNNIVDGKTISVADPTTGKIADNY